MTLSSAIILAGGTGTRLYPLTHTINKHLVPVFGKFILDYPLETLKQMGIKNLTVVLGGDHFDQVVSHLKDGFDFGMMVNYVYQARPSGIAQGVNLCERFIPDDEFAVILGDNIFEAPVQWQDVKGAQIVLHAHEELHRFGVAGISKETAKIELLAEKPKTLNEGLDNFAITGCYRFDRRFFKFFKGLKPSARNEFEIVDIIEAYHRIGELTATFTQPGSLWSDAGTHETINFLNDHFFHQQKEKSE